MPLTELTIDELIPQNEYYVETNIGNLVDKFKATFSHIEGKCAMFVNTFLVIPTGFRELKVNTRLCIIPHTSSSGWQKIFYKISDNIRHKVENQNEFIYEAAFQKVMRDVFCHTIHYNENGQPMYDENGMFFNYKDVFLNMCNANKSTKV
jgi:hypothetical protein